MKYIFNTIAFPERLFKNVRILLRLCIPFFVYHFFMIFFERCQLLYFACQLGLTRDWKIIKSNDQGVLIDIALDLRQFLYVSTILIINNRIILFFLLSLWSYTRCLQVFF